MTDRFRFDLAPNAEFADRLEVDLLRAIGGRTPSPTTRTFDVPDTEEHLVTIEKTATHDQTRRRTISAVASVAAVVLLVAGIGLIASRDTDSPASVNATEVTFTVMWAYSEIVNECAESTSTRVCLNRFEMPAAAEFSGDIVGAGNQVVLWNDPADYPGQDVDHLEHVVTYNVEAEVEGCGAGEFMLVEMMQFVSGAARDRDSGTYIGTWQIVTESGRNGLASIEGRGTSTGLFGTAGDVGRTFTGTANCT